MYSLDILEQGERRFYLGAVVDDLFLSTGEWEFEAEGFEGQMVRFCSRMVLINTVSYETHATMEVHLPCNMFMGLFV